MSILEFFDRHEVLAVFCVCAIGATLGWLGLCAVDISRNLGGRK